MHSPVSIKDVDFSVDVVYKKLKGLKSNKAPGPDNIHPAVLRECCDVLSVPLSIFFQSVLMLVLFLLIGELLMLHLFLKRVIIVCHVTIDQLV